MSPINDLDTPTCQRARKHLASLSAALALRGWALIKGDPAVEGQAPFLVTRWGVGAMPMESLEAVSLFLDRLQEVGHGPG